MPKFQFKFFLMLIRALFPRWNFFDHIGYQFYLEYRTPEAPHWQPVSFDIQRRPLNLFINPEAHLALLQVGVLEHFTDDLQKLMDMPAAQKNAEVLSLTTYKLIKDILKSKLHAQGIKTKTVQFKIVANQSNELLDVYISGQLAMGSL